MKYHLTVDIHNELSKYIFVNLCLHIYRSYVYRFYMFVWRPWIPYVNKQDLTNSTD